MNQLVTGYKLYFQQDIVSWLIIDSQYNNSAERLIQGHEKKKIIPAD